MNIDFTGKTVLVTGGGRGLGKEMALGLQDVVQMYTLQTVRRSGPGYRERDRGTWRKVVSKV